MKVSKILLKKASAPLTIKPAESIVALSRLLREHRKGAAVVTQDGVTIDGFVSERDIAYSLCVHNADLSSLPVSAIMTKSVITCRPDDDAGKVATVMQAHHIRHVPVVDNVGLCGMVSIRDLLNLRVDELQQETAMLRSMARRSPGETQDR